MQKFFIVPTQSVGTINTNTIYIQRGTQGFCRSGSAAKGR